MTKVKICGISQVAHALAVVEAGADFVGLVFAPSKRQVSLQTAQQIVQEVKRFGQRPLVVGVFVNIVAREVNRLATFCGLDWVQLSGNESWEYCKQIERPIIKVIHVPSTRDTEKIMDELSLGHKILASEGFTGLLDTEVKGAYGGTGQTFEWELASQVLQKYQMIIAGGLSPANVGQVIQTVKPWGVDISTGVETEGSKNVAKIQAFIQAVRKVDEDVR